MDKVLFSSNKDDWCTPQDVFDALDKEFHFTIDVAASDSNAKCEKYYTKEIDGLTHSWDGVAFCNPPYGRDVIKWVKKADEERRKGNTVVMLIAARTDTRFFHEYIYKKDNVEVRFIKGRLKFTDENGKAYQPAPFPSMVVVFKPVKECKNNVQSIS